ncbi:staygreen family protein, partial [Escherichia coli]|nr:staygreen family protein [Escherichia coli]
HHTDKSIQAIRYAIFNKEMPVLLTALRYGDHFFFRQMLDLDHAPIYVHYHSNYPEFHTIRYMETPSVYETIKR